jgi:hypothetical protein
MVDKFYFFLAYPELSVLHKFFIPPASNIPYLDTKIVIVKSKESRFFSGFSPQLNVNTLPPLHKHQPVNFVEQNNL